MNHHLGLVPDDDLLALVRTGVSEAFDELYARHRGDVEAYARRLCPAPSMVDDVVAEAFFKTLRAIRNGRGPEDGFRLYVFTAARRTAARMTQVARDEVPGLEGEVIDLRSVDDDDGLARVEGAGASIGIRALRSLPLRAQRTLWLLEVEGWTTAELGALLGLSTNAASALAYRSRQRLREAYTELARSEEPSAPEPQPTERHSEAATGL